MEKRDVTILLITDNAAAVLGEADILEKGGYAVRIAAEGKEAIECVRDSGDIDLVAIDLDHCENQRAAWVIREIREIRPLPIVLLATHDIREPMELVGDGSIYGLIPKGSPGFALLSAIRTSLDHFAADQTISVLMREQAMLKRAERAARVGCWELDLATGRIIGSDGAREIYGVAEPEDLLESIKMMPLPEYRPLLDTALEGLIAEKKPYSVVFKIRRRSDGGIVDIHSTAEYDPRTGIVFGTIQDITSQTESESELQESEGRYRSLFRENSSVMLLIDPEDFRIIDANAAACAFYGWTWDELVSRYIYEINTLAPADIKKEMAAACDLKRNYFLFRHRLANGGLRDVEVYSGPIVLKGKRLLYSVVHDVTEARKTQEENTRLLAEKELILKEVHHRIKNNMEMIASLLSLQAASMDDGPASLALTDARSRVVGMMEIYDGLYRAPDFHTVNAKEYFEELFRDMRSSYGAGRPIALEARIEDIMLDSRLLIPLGIIVNELVTDALKYAFPDGRSGRIGFSMEKGGDGRIEARVEDDGIGFGSPQSGSKSGFGLILVDALAKQIDAVIDRKTDSGTCYKLTFWA